MKNRELAEMLGGMLAQISAQPDIDWIRVRGLDGETVVIDRRHVIGYQQISSITHVHESGSSTCQKPENTWFLHMSGGWSFGVRGYTEEKVIAVLGIEYVAEYDPDYPNK